MSKTGTSALKGKTYEEIHGVYKANELKKRRSLDTKGRKRSEKTKKLLSDCAKKRVGSKNPFFGKKHSRKTREAISKTRREMFAERQTVNKQVRRYWRVAEWTALVLERDNYTCQTCGAKNYAGLGETVRLEAHHKVELHNIIENMCFDEVIKLPELYDLSNGITLCYRCHKNVHRKEIL